MTAANAVVAPVESSNVPKSVPEAEVLETTIELSRDYVHATARKLVDRIDARFGSCELKRLAELVEKAAASSDTRLRGPYRLGFLVKVLVWPAVFVALLSLAYGFHYLHLRVEVGTAGDFVQSLNSALEILIMIAAASWFFLSLGSRLVRRGLKKAVQELAAFVHMADFAQLDKDPDRLTWKPSEITPQSPRMGKVSTAFLLSRYLDYCGEILSLIAKIGALYATQVSDESVLNDLTELEKQTHQLRAIIGAKMSAITRG